MCGRRCTEKRICGSLVSIFNYSTVTISFSKSLRRFLMENYQSPAILSAGKSPILYSQGEVAAVVVMFLALLLFGAFALCIAAGYRGVEFLKKVWRNGKIIYVILYCVK